MLPTLALLVISVAYPDFAVKKPAPVTAVAYSPDGAQVLFGIRGEVHLADAKSREPIRKHALTDGRITSAVWLTPKRFVVATGEPGKHGTIVIFEDGQQTHTWKAHNDSIYALAVSADGRTIFSAGYDRVIKKWSMEAGAWSTDAMEFKDHSDAVYGLALHPNGKLLASCSADRTVKIWDTTNGKRLYSLGDSTDWLATLAWSPDGKTLAAAGTDKSLRVWAADEKSGTLLKAVFAHGGPLVKLSYTPDGRSIVTAGDDKIIKIWDAKTLTERLTIPAQPDVIHTLSVRPDGKQIAVGRHDGQCIAIDTVEGKTVGSIPPFLPKPPKIVSVSPGFVSRNSSVKITITGTGLDTVREIKIKDAHVNRLTQTATAITAEVTVLAKAPVGPLPIVLSSPLGDSNAMPITIERYPVFETKDLNSTLVPLDRIILGTLDRAGDADPWVFKLDAGQDVGMTIDAPKFTPVLSVEGPDRNTVAVSSKKSLGFTATKAGLYTVRIRDREYRGGKDFSYRLSLGQVPVVTGVFPPVVGRGQEMTVAVSGVHFKDKVQYFSVAEEDANAKTAKLWPTEKDGQSSAEPVVIAIEDRKQRISKSLAANLDPPFEALDAVINQPHGELIVTFRAKKDEEYIIEGLAQRYGSPVDPRIEIVDANGSVVPRAVLRCTAKTNLTFRDHDSTKPGLRLETWNELATNDLLLIDNEIVKIQQLPGHPDADCDFFDKNGVRLSFFDTTNTHHAKDAAMYKIELHPPGTTFPPNGMPVVRLDYRNDDGGPGYGKDAKLMFKAPADGEYRVKLSNVKGTSGPDHFVRVTVRKPKPDFAVKVTPSKPVVPAGGTLPISVNIDRFDGYDGPVRVKLVDLPEGFSSAEGVIEPGFFNTTIGLSASADAKPGPKPIKMIATTPLGQSHELSLDAPTIDGKPDILTKVETESLRIRPGEEVRFIVTIERSPGFKNRVPIEVRGLPHGVTVQNIGLNKIMITEKETRREVVLRAEPWVKPMTAPLVVTAIREGKNAPSAAKPLPLQVDPTPGK